MKQIKSNVILFILGAISLIVLSVMGGCKKAEETPMYSIRYNVYAGHGSFKYYNAGWKEIPVTGATSLSVSIPESDLHFNPQIKSTGIDSVYISAEHNGKVVRNTYKSNVVGTSINLSVSLNDIK